MTTTTHKRQGPAAAAFKELDALNEAERNLNARLRALHDELEPIGWRGRPAIAPVPPISNGDRGVAPSGRIAELLREIPREQTAAAREGRDPAIAVAKIEAELAPLEKRSEQLRSEIGALVREIRQGVPAQRVDVARRYRAQLAAHARQIAADRAEHADAFVAAARQLLEHRAEVYEALRLAQTGRPVAIADAQWAEMSRHLVASLMPWTDANQPALIALWRAVETVAAAGTFAVAETGEPAESEAA
jgi:hypothetical protein